MKNNILVLLIAFIFFNPIFTKAQLINTKVSGIISDNNAKPLVSLTVVLKRAKDSITVKVNVSDKNGQFEFERIAAGKYFVAVSAIGYQKGVSPIFELTTGNTIIELKPIILSEQSVSLKEVTVSSSKPLIEQKIDRMIVNVESSITSAGNSVLEVLEKSPGITVDKDGNISLKGKSGVQIYIDGRPSYLSGADLANMLRGMSASQMEQIEIMTNPPAKYDAAGNSGVINLKTKKNKVFGFNGNITGGYTQATYVRINNGANFNYRAGKINLFSSYNYNHGNRAQRLEINRNFYNTGTDNIISSFEQKAIMKNENSFLSGKVGMDYFASKKTTIGITLNAFRNPRNNISNNVTHIRSANGSPKNITNAETENESLWRNFGGNVNMRQLLNSSGSEITADFDLVKYQSDESQSLFSSYFDQLGNRSQPSDSLLTAMPQQITILSGKVDYSLPIKKDAKFEAGIKGSKVRTDNDATYLIGNGGHTTLDSGRYNHFIYTENIAAAYVNYNKQINKHFSAQIGLRLESTNSIGHSAGFKSSPTQNRYLPYDSTFNRTYAQLFPTLYFQYTANEKNQFVLNYGRRINRPNYGDLNPFQHFIDRYTYGQGNPNLKPQFSHNIELTHTYGGFLTTTLNYTVVKDIIQEVFEQNELTNESYIKKSNIAKQHQFGISVSLYKEFKKWWSGNIYMNTYMNDFDGIVNNEPIKISYSTLLLSLQQQFKFNKGWAAELSGNYQTKSLEGVIFIRPLGQLSVGCSKQVFKNKATFRLNINDVFASQNFNGFSRYGNVDANFKQFNDSRAVSINFTYRIAKGKLKAPAKRKTGGSSEEEKRVNAGGN